MRMFVAVEPSETARDDLDAFLDVRRSAAAYRWTDAEHLHLTLAFLGEVADHRVEELERRLAEAAARRPALTASITGGGAFPHVAEARVLYAGVDASTDLEPLARGCRTAATTSGIEVDGRRFLPHLTVARMGRPVEATRWVRLLDGYRGPEFPVAEVSLVASYLGEGRRRRPRHETVATFALGPASHPSLVSHER